MHAARFEVIDFCSMVPVLSPKAGGALGDLGSTPLQTQVFKNVNIEGMT